VLLNYVHFKKEASQPQADDRRATVFALPILPPHRLDREETPWN
jgi:hypothetical protein